MSGDVWKRRDVAAAFLTERSLLIPDRPRQVEVMLRLIRFTPRAPERILDIGTGDGILLATLLETYPKSTGVGVDFSPHMLEKAQTRLAAFGTRALTREADLRNSMWKADIGTFDAVVSGFAIHHLPDERKKAIYWEIHDLLNVGGLFLNMEHVASATPRLEQIFDEAMADHLYERRHERGENVSRDEVHREFLGRPDRGDNILALVEGQCRWLRELGFRDVDCFWKYFELAIFGGWK